MELQYAEIGFVSVHVCLIMLMICLHQIPYSRLRNSRKKPPELMIVATSPFTRRVPSRPRRTSSRRY